MFYCVKSFLCYIGMVGKGKHQGRFEKESPEKNEGWPFWELIRFAFIVLVIVIPVRVFVAEPFVVSGSSMIPALESGNYLIVDKISYRLNDPQRNDVVIFRYPNDQTKFFVKRIIGLPNETVDIKGNVITITNREHPNGFKLEEPYVKNIGNNTTHFESKSGEYFVMGDNRNASSDSRYWGVVKKELIAGRAFLRLLPIGKMDVWPGNYSSK